MPSLRGVTVYVTDKEGNNLPEWGVQHLRRHANGSLKSEKVSAYIQSTTDVQFRVTVQPRIPFINVDYTGSEPDFMNVVGGGPNRSRRSRHHGKPASRLRSDSEDPSKEHEHGTKHDDANLSLSSPVRQSQTGDKHPNFSFLAALYLDGRSEPERRIIVYLNPSDSDFNRPDGKVVFKHRWVQSRERTMTEHAWVFKEKAIETVFDRLMINVNHGQSEGRDVDAMIEAMQTSEIDGLGDSKNEKSRVGQIVVQIHRIVLGTKWLDRDYRPKHREGRDEDIDTEGLKPDVTHTTGFSRTGSFTSSPIRVVDYVSYKPGEGPWATFQFFYRSAGTYAVKFITKSTPPDIMYTKLCLSDIPGFTNLPAEQLQKFGFEGFPSVVKPARTGRSLNARMAFLSPMSIRNALPPKPERSRDAMSYEEKIRRKAFNSRSDEPKPNFGSDYRDASADDEFEAEEVYKYPAAPLPFLRPKAPRLGPQRDISIPGLVTLDHEGASAVVSKITAALAGPTIPDNVDSADQPLIPSVTTAFYIPKPDSHRRPKPYPDLSEAPKESTPPNFTQEQGPSPSTLSKENVAKFDTPFDNDYRLSSQAYVHNSDGDDEDEDNPPNTESDLETHDGDDDFEYAVNEEEEEEDAVGLRSRLQNVAIGKRSRATIEDAKDKEEGHESRTGATCGAADGEHAQDVDANMLLMAGEKEEVRHGKKARTDDPADGQGPGHCPSDPKNVKWSGFWT